MFLLVVLIFSDLESHTFHAPLKQSALGNQPKMESHDSGKIANSHTKRKSCQRSQELEGQSLKRRLWFSPEGLEKRQEDGGRLWKKRGAPPGGVTQHLHGRGSQPFWL